MSRKVIERKLRTDRWRVACPGVYVTHTGALSTTQRHWVAVLAAGADRDVVGDESPACLGGLSALQAAGLRNITSPSIHVLIAARRQVKPPVGVTIHRTRTMPDHIDTRHVSPPGTLPGRSVVDAAQWARSNREASLIVATAFQQRLVSFADVVRALSNKPADPTRSACPAYRAGQ